MLEAFLVSTAVVALGEIGDKTQLLALLLAARFRQPRPIILGILVATLANHAGASLLGAWLARVVDPQWMRWVLGGSFLAVAAWMLVPDKADGLDSGNTSRFGVFGVTTVAFFLAEMGDKTQIATVMLAARYESLVVVTAGTTLGMMIANVPAVLLGERIVNWVPVQWVHRVAAAVFALLGALMLLGAGG
ncbi:MAG: TMEM165/GDT1 family protein [Rubrivivax sp.]|nr:TMEM165/GDT1 family protein [Rubrivivax sp.]